MYRLSGYDHESIYNMVSNDDRTYLYCFRMVI